MDPLTHGLLGATIGQALFARRLGGWGLLAGAVAAMAPDLDVVMMATGPMGDWIYHRGVTHSIWVAALLGPALAYAAARSQAGGRRAWTLLFVLTLLSHPLLDWCTSYGTQLLAPLSAHRFALDAVAIIDPAYSLLLLAALLVGAWRGVAARGAALSAAVALVLSTAYLGHGLMLNRESAAHRMAAVRGHAGRAGGSGPRDRGGPDPRVVRHGPDRGVAPPVGHGQRGRDRRPPLRLPVAAAGRPVGDPGAVRRHGPDRGTARAHRPASARPRPPAPRADLPADVRPGPVGRPQALGRCRRSRRPRDAYMTRSARPSTCSTLSEGRR